MPMDGLMLRYITKELCDTLIGGRIDKVVQPESDTLVLTIRNLNANHKLLLCASPNNARCHLTQMTYSSPPEPPMFCMLLRKHLYGGRLVNFQQLHGDRQLCITIEAMDEMKEKTIKTLILEIMGRHSNLTLINDQGRIMDAIRHVNGEMSRVREVLPGLPYIAPPKQDKLSPEMITLEAATAFFASTDGLLSKALSSFISGLSRPSATELALRTTGNTSSLVDDYHPDTLAQKLLQVLSTLDSLAPSVVQKDDEGLACDVFPFPYQAFDMTHQVLFETPSMALESFFASRDQKDRIKQKSASLVRTVKTHIERCEKKLAHQEEELNNASLMEAYRIKGELLNANLYQLQKGQPIAIVENFYDADHSLLEIPMDVKLSPAQNAQRYFKRYQKARSAKAIAKEQKIKTEQELAILESALEDLGKCTEESELAEIRSELQKNGYVRPERSSKLKRKFPQSKPYVYLSSDGIQILVGKNSLQNERLTSSASGNQTWLHAKDMPGSHVIICHEGETPDTTLLEAAQLAAYYSKGRQSASVPIDYTYRRFVKKPNGSPTGFVIYTNQRTLFMTVSKSDILNIKEII